jgi:hypothetical protein
MQNLQANIANFNAKTQQFCELLGMSLDTVEALKETDSPDGNEFYAVYMAFQHGIWPSADFLNKYRKAA